MKNLSLALNFILIIAVAILFYLHFSENKISTESPVQPTFLESPASIISDSALHSTAYINTDTLFEKYEYVKDVRDDLAAEKIKLESHYGSEVKKLEKEIGEFQEKAKYMTQQEGETRQAELAQKEQGLMKLEQELSGKLSDLEIEKNKQIQKLVLEYLKNFNREKKFAYVFGYNGMGNVLYADSQFNITQIVVDGLNAEYTSKKVEMKK